jgi:hypothetical protein
MVKVFIFNQFFIKNEFNHKIDRTINFHYFVLFIKKAKIIEKIPL